MMIIIITITLSTSSAIIFKIADGVKPTLAELEKFDRRVDSVEVKMDVESQSFIIGDVVEVVEGSMTALQGKVIKIDGKMVTIQSKHEEFKVCL